MVVGSSLKVHQFLMVFSSVVFVTECQQPVGDRGFPLGIPLNTSQMNKYNGVWVECWKLVG